MSMWLASWGNGADKSGVSPQVLSLPKGPGSIEGLGEAFQPSLNTGTAKSSVAFKLPPGTAGHSPVLALVYEGGDGNGPLGMGWQLPLPYVQRQTDKGIPHYDATDHFINDSREELVPVQDEAEISFFCKNEGGFVRYRRTRDHWEGRQPDGTRLIYGESAAARVADSSDTTKVFRWYLEQSIDTRGNSIRFRYAAADGDKNLNQVYCVGVDYGPGPGPWTKFHFVNFVYEARSDWFEDCRSGFPVRTGQRLKQVFVGTQGVDLPNHAAGDFNRDGQGDFLDRRYDLAYQPDASVSLVASITQFGSDNITSLPPSRYQYTLCAETAEIEATGNTIESSNTPALLFDNATVDFVDMNGDSLPDLLRTIGGGSGHQIYFNQGERMDQFGSYLQWASVDYVTSGGPAPASALSLNGQETLLADFNGDGVSDFVQMSGSATYFFPNRPLAGGAFWGARSAILGALPPSPFGPGGNVKTGDFDFDKRIDVIRSVGTNGYDVWFNRGAGEFSAPVRTTTSSYDFTVPEVKMADINGDRLVDVARIFPAEIRFTAGLGHGRFTEERIILIPDFILTAAQITKASLQDVNGDGTADLVVDRPFNREIWFWPNRGNLTFGNRIRVYGLPATFAADAAVRWLDVNGNGTTDIAIARNGVFAAVDLGRLTGCVPKSFLLKRIENGIGRVETILYTTSVEFALEDGTDVSGEYSYSWPHPLPFPVTVIGQIDTADGMNHSYATHFRYHNGYYDPLEKQFRGFGRVEQIDVGDSSAPTLVSKMEFDTGATDETRKGKILRAVKTTEGGDVFTDEATTWRTRELHTGLDGRSIQFASLERVSLDVLERGVGQPQRIETEADYDNYGNQIMKREFGRVIDGDPMAGGDQRQTVTEYALNLNNWLIRAPKRTEVRSFGPGGLDPVFSRRESFYDDETFAGSNLGSITIGNPTMTREWPDPSQATQFITTSRSRFDAFGNPVALLDPLYGSQPGHSRDISYDSSFHAFPEAETIHIGAGSADLVFTAAFDYGFGVMTSATEFSGNQTRFAYDPLARLISIVKPGDTDAAPTEAYGYSLGQSITGGRTLNWIETKKRETEGGDTFDCRDFVDGLGRNLGKRSEGEAAGQIVVSGVTVFNARRSAWKTYLPYFDTGSLAFAELPASPPEFTETNYDALGRAIRAIKPPETIGGLRRSARTDFLPLETVFFDEEDNDPGSPHFNTPHHQFKDGLDRLIGVDEINRENGSLVTYPTRYLYDLRDQLVRITDSQNNVKKMTYDGLKRMTFMHDPDRGVMTYTYDVASNLTQTVDAKNQSIVMTYDGTNRLKTEDYLDARGLTPDVTYFYDTAVTVPAGDGTSATSNNVNGKLAAVTDLSGGEVFSYDARGRTISKIKRIPDALNGQLVSYQSQFTYDSLDRVTQLTYPDGDNVGCTYNTRSLPKAITGGPGGFILPNMSYTASGQLENQSFGNGVSTSYQYDPRRRVRALSTVSPTSTKLIDFAYTFDAASNITRIDDNRTNVPSNDPRKNTQVFGYDDLYRIVQAQYPATSALISYSYDRIGNILSQASSINDTENGLPLTNLGILNYGGSAGTSNRLGRNGGQPGPHALTTVSAGSRTYFYDANGNTETIDGMTCSWDFKDRLVAVENSTMRADYTYDYTDRRIAKRVTPKSGGVLEPASADHTFYVDRTFELRPGLEIVKYVWNGENRVARVTTNLNATQRIQRFALQPGWNILALAVRLNDSTAQILTAPVQQVYRQGAGLGQYGAILPNEPIPEGTLLRVYATAATTLSVRGTWTAPTAVNVPAGRQWLLNTRFVPLDLATSLPASDPLWFFDATTQGWRTRIPSLTAASTHPAKLLPGEAIFTAAAGPYTLSIADPTLEIRYYHPDILGSATVTTDATGQLVTEAAFYPFGRARNELEPREVRENYKFTSKEHDVESGLDQFAARYLAGAEGRFLSCDPQGAGAIVANPQSWNPYSYCLNNPIKHNDPNGESATLIGAVTGGIIGGAVALWRHEDVAKGALVGAISGAIAGSVIDTGGASLGMLALSGAAGNVSGGLLGRALNGQGSTVGDVAKDAAIGGALGFAGGVAGKVIGKAVSSVRASLSSAEAGVSGIENCANSISANNGPKRIVLGENMDRVRPVAQQLGAETFEGSGMEANRAWIRTKLAQGYEAYDIGPDFARRAQRLEQGVGPDSPFYIMERMETKNYDKYFKLFDRNGE